MLRRRASNDVRVGMGYVPDGISPEQWKKMQEKEKNKKVIIVYAHALHFNPLTSFFARLFTILPSLVPADREVQRNVGNAI